MCFESNVSSPPTTNTTRSLAFSLHRSLPRCLPLSRSHRCRGRNAEGQQRSCEQKRGEAIAAEARGNSRSEEEPKRAQPACQKERKPSQANTERQTLTLRAHVMVARPLSRWRRSSTAGPCTTSSSLGSSFPTATSFSSPSTWPSTLSPWSLPLTPSLHTVSLGVGADRGGLGRRGWRTYNSLQP